MPTNDERREVAARLRNWESFRETFRESPICAALDVLNVEGYLDWRNIFELLADLIEPEPERTCKAIPSEPKMYSNKYEQVMLVDEWHCGGCGVLFISSVPNYCPSCGAKVVKE